MRCESCRKCGVELKALDNEGDKCVVCRMPTRFVCPKCKKETDVQIHQHIYVKPKVQTPAIFAK